MLSVECAVGCVVGVECAMGCVVGVECAVGCVAGVASVAGSVAGGMFATAPDDSLAAIGESDVVEQRTVDSEVE